MEKYDQDLLIDMLILMNQTMSEHTKAINSLREDVSQLSISNSAILLELQDGWELELEEDDEDLFDEKFEEDDLNDL
jgi:hypothetical protein